jgi:hypothetical protein
VDANGDIQATRIELKAPSFTENLEIKGTIST